MNSRKLLCLLAVAALAAAAPRRAAAVASGDVSVTKSVDQTSAITGQNVTYTITVHNNGPNSAQNVSVSDTLPSGLSFVSSQTTGGSCSGTTTVTCTIGTMGNNGTVTITITATITASGGATIDPNSATSSASNDPSAGNNTGTSDSITVQTPDDSPTFLAVDREPSSGTSDLNNVFEANETVRVDPSWTNNLSGAVGFTGAVSLFTGPGDGGGHATYSITDDSADYGIVPANSPSDCDSATGNCYELTLTLDDPANRPAAHWDATVLETLSTGETKTWTLHIGDSFSGDVSRSNVFYQAIETIFHNNITLGCGVSQFCPTNSTRRDEMAAFIARSLEGSDAAVPVSGTGYDCAGSTSNFADVPAGSTFCRHANLLFVDGITIGCGGGNFCPADQILRRDAAVLVARAMNVKAALPAEPVPNFGTDGGTRSYNCDTVNDHDGIPAGTSPFPDVLATDVFCPHVGFLWVNHVVNGDTNGNFRPGDQIRRDEMATMLSHAFVSLPLYGP